MLSSVDKESASLPPPSTLFGGHYYYQPSAVDARSGYSLPPPSSFPGYHLPPPQHYTHQSPNSNDTYNNIYYYQPTVEGKRKEDKPKQRKRRQAADSTTTTKKKRATTLSNTPPYHYGVLELQKSTKKQRKEAETMSAAAATLASFAHKEDEECVNLAYATCVDQGGSFECDQCDSNYKHLNCLQRHKWEHKGSKQQTQVLEVYKKKIFFSQYLSWLLKKKL